MKYPCDQFTEQRNLKTNIQSVHEKIKYPCYQCDYHATAKGSLKTHVLSIHEKVKYRCNQCDYQATTQGSLKTHIQSVHEKVKYSCNHVVINLVNREIWRNIFSLYYMKKSTSVLSNRVGSETYCTSYIVNRYLQTNIKSNYNFKYADIIVSWWRVWLRWLWWCSRQGSRK